MTSPSLFLSLSFGGYCLLVMLLAVRASRSAWPILAWAALTGGLAASEMLQEFSSFPPPLMRLIVLALALTTFMVWRRRDWTASWSLAGLVAFQAFRLPLELLMHQAANDGVMPPQMSFTGRNFDIVTGLLAVPLALLVARGKAKVGWVWAWNLLGLGLLINVVAVAVMSFPGPLRSFWNEPANVWITHFPFVWLPTVLVPLA